ncbi:hypothetical protein [Intestinimonas butyriciproducens]|uniref:hypothetical protein n=1 Tax=Intestinimonas butyriciproducens TaxID=1297617 RepID=UPI00195EAB7D|nr:hypothetical protein [Intestinimonas butyriciproducens]MBM6976446.1 hypothetical protein [Intestinimonas butyriciproducens]
MNPIYQFRTLFGNLEVETDGFYEVRVITFEEAALTISGINIRTISYQLEVQANLPPDTARSFEKYLLSEPHSFKREDVKEIEKKFYLSRYFPKSLGITFFLDDSSDIWFAVSPSDAKKNTFIMELWDENAEDIDPSYSWEIKIGANEDILVKALEYVCLLTKAIHDIKLPNFINKMNLLNG